MVRDQLTNSSFELDRAHHANLEAENCAACHVDRSRCQAPWPAKAGDWSAACGAFGWPASSHAPVGTGQHASSGAMPRASLRSLFLICADSAAFICRVSTQITGKPASANALYSHCDKGPASRPMRSMASASSVRTARIATGLVATLTSRITLPALSTMHTLVSFTETSNPI